MPTRINDNGFFSDEAKSLCEAIRHEHRQLFFYLAELNEQAHQFLGKLKFRPDDVKQALTVALLCRALTRYQALILLGERGFDSEMRAMCRSLLEIKFKLGFLAKEPTAAFSLLAKHEKERANRLRKMKAGVAPVPSELIGQDWDALIAQAEANQKNADGTKHKIISVQDMAKICGLESDYAGPYSFFLMPSIWERESWD